MHVYTLSTRISTRVSSIIQNQTRAFIKAGRERESIVMKKLKVVIKVATLSRAAMKHKYHET
jgi:hypothetical protein